LERLSFVVQENQQKNLPENQEHRIHRMQNSSFFFRFKSYEYQLLQGAGAQDNEVCYTWRCYVLSKPGDDKRAKILFSDVDTSYLSEQANRHNFNIWWSDNPHAATEGKRDGLFIQKKVLGLYLGGRGTDVPSHAE
jgi:hypothetical protein